MKRHHEGATMEKNTMTQTEKVQEILNDGQWHNAEELKKAAKGYGYGPVLQRLKKSGTLETRPTGHGRAMEYRIVGVWQVRTSTGNTTGQPTGTNVTVSGKVFAAAVIAKQNMEAFVAEAAERAADIIIAKAQESYTVSVNMN